jgi:hypothetical protein
MEKKNQHLVPESYLKAWCDPATPEGECPYVWAFDKDGAAVKRKAPKNVFVEIDTYTITGPEGEHGLQLENRLSELETMFVKVKREKIEREEPLDEGDRAALLMFAAAMFNRTASQREHQGEQWGTVHDKSKKLEQVFATTTVPAQLAPHDGPSLTMSEVERIVQQPLQHTLGAYTNATYTLFKTLDMAILKATTEPGFITSDKPCFAGAEELSFSNPQIDHDGVWQAKANTSD